jgi:hypothetical protein
MIWVHDWQQNLPVQPRALTTDIHLQLHGAGCGICTYNAYGRPFDRGNIGVKESKCTHVTDSVAYLLVAGVIGTHCSTAPKFSCCSKPVTKASVPGPAHSTEALLCAGRTPSRWLRYSRLVGRAGAVKQPAVSDATAWSHCSPATRLRVVQHQGRGRPVPPRILQACCRRRQVSA